MGSKMLAETSVRAGIDPFLGLKAAWPSCEPHTFTQLTSLSWSGAPFGSPKVSQTMTYFPVVPGDGAAGDRGVDDLYAGVLVLVDLEHLGQAVGLTTRGPPAKDLEIASATGGAGAGSARREKIGEAQPKSDATSRLASSCDKLAPSPTVIRHKLPSLVVGPPQMAGAQRVYVERDTDYKKSAVSPNTL